MALAADGVNCPSFLGLGHDAFGWVWDVSGRWSLGALSYVVLFVAWWMDGWMDGWMNS